MAKNSYSLIAATVVFSLVALGIVCVVFVVVIGQARPEVIERFTGPAQTTTTVPLGLVTTEAQVGS